jgi:alpha-L-fucosidase
LINLGTIQRILIFSAMLWSTAAQAQARPQPQRPGDFKPFRPPYSTEELRDNFSANEMARAHKEMQRVMQVNTAGAYQPTWLSLDGHELPEWFKDAKFGMFIDWGLYSVPGYAPTGYPDWYMWRMIYGDTKDYHEKVWGKDFRRDDFIPLFTAAEYDPELLAKVAKDAGMKYVIPFTKHHDGFALWNSSYTFRNAAAMGPKRDLIRPLAEALHNQGLKLGFYFSLDEWEYPVINEQDKLNVRMWHTKPDSTEVHTVPYSSLEFDGKISGKIPVRDFYNDYVNPQAIEFIDNYDPDIIWFDGDWIVGADERNSRSIVAYFYNHAKGRKEVAVNDRAGNVRNVLPCPQCGELQGTIPHGDFYTSENAFKSGGDGGPQHYWEECSGLSASFGYNWRDSNENVRSANQVIQMLVDVVSKGGNLLLITNLTGDGKLDPLLADRLKTVGAWLNTNGAAIYATRTWTHFKQGDDIRFTKSKDGKYVYAIALKWPGKSLVLQSVHAEKGSTITMLGSPDPLSWHQDGNDLVIALPASSNESTESAWAFKIQQEVANTQ